MSTLSYVADKLYPIKGEQINFTVTNTYGGNATYLWYFFSIVDGVGTLITPTYLANTTSTSKDIKVSFDTILNITPLLYAFGVVPSTPPPIYPPSPTDGTVYSYIEDYIKIVSSSGHVYSLTSPTLDSLLLTTTGFRELAIKLTSLNPLTLVEDNITSNIEDITTVVSVNGFVILETEALDISLPVSTDGVYYLYTRFNSRENKHIFVNNKTILEYIDSLSLENICCSPNSTVNYPTFKQKDYIFNVVSNLVNSFLGIELSDLEFNYGEITDNDNIYSNKVYQCVSVGTGSPSWIVDDHFVLEVITGSSIFSTSHLTTGDTYKALYTSSPSFGGDIVSAYTTDFHTQMQDMAEIIYKVNQYLIGNDNISC